MNLLRTVAWLSTAVAAAAGYAVLTRRVRRRETSEADARAREAIVDRASPSVKRVAEVTGHIGKWYTHVPLTALTAGLLFKHHRGAAGAAIAGSSLGAAALVRLLERIHDHRVPPPGKRQEAPGAQSYPSGHAFETTAVALATAWVLAREHLVPPWLGATLASVAALVSGIGRLLLDRHWTTDSAAGYLGGLAVAATAASSYELTRWN